MNATTVQGDPSPGWRVLLREKGILAITIAVFFLFGANLERRTALKRVPQTDLGVFTTAAAAIASGGNVYAVTDWHGWHYVYPPALAILFYPLAFPIQYPPSAGAPRTTQNTPWGYPVDSGDDFYGLHKDNFPFFCIVAIWYSVSVALTFLSVHLLVCALEGSLWRHAPPADSEALQKWWRLRYVPLLVCLTSIGTEFSRGQVDVVMLFAVAAGLYLAVHRRGFAAGVFLSIPAVIKMLPPLILLLPFWNRQWRVLYGITLGLTLTVLVIPAARLGLAGTVRAYRDWGNLLLKPGMIGGKDATLANELTDVNASDNQSLLAFTHNWSYHTLARAERPREATPQERLAAYGFGGLMFLGFVAATGFRRRRTSRELLIIAGILIGMVFVVCPIVHNYYYLLLMPLFVGLIDAWFEDAHFRRGKWNIPAILVTFVLIDILARIPTVGIELRDAGLPFVSLLALMLAGISVLRGTADCPTIS